MQRDSEEINVMVAGAHSTGALGAIRSLGRAGYVVHAAAGSPDAIGLRSNFAKYSVVHPDAADPSFAEWVHSYIQKYNVQMIIAGGAITPGTHPVFSDYMHLFPVNSSEAVLSKHRKYEMFEALLAGDAEHRANLPPLMLVDLTQDLPSREGLAKLGSPLFIKLDGYHSSAATGDQVIRVPSADEALERLGQLKSDYRKAVVQGYVDGIGVGAFFLRWDGEIKARFMHRRIHEMPHTGGASSLRESWWHEDLLADAEAKLSHIGWEGVAMVEYRWDPSTDRYYLMEMNLRFWGSIHLALYSGVDFPKHLAESFLGQELSQGMPPIIGLKCRHTFPSEIGYLVSLWRDKQVAFSRKLYSIWEAIWLTLDFRVKNDLLFPADRKLFWYRLGCFLRTGQ